MIKGRITGAMATYLNDAVSLGQYTSLQYSSNDQKWGYLIRHIKPLRSSHDIPITSVSELDVELTWVESQIKLYLTGRPLDMVKWETEIILIPVLRTGPSTGGVKAVKLGRRTCCIIIPILRVNGGQVAMVNIVRTHEQPFPHTPASRLRYTRAHH